MINEIHRPHTRLAYPALSELRPRWADEAEFAQYVDDTLRPLGYRLIGWFDTPGAAASAVAGIRVAESLSVGRYLYVDDLSTMPEARRRGHARQLLDWLADEARRLGCAQIHLDSGVGPDRAAAHRAYLNAGYLISAHHFATAVV